MSERTLLGDVRAWFVEETRGLQEIDAKVWASLGYERFRGNPDFVDGWLDATLQRGINKVINDALSDDRTRVWHQGRSIERTALASLLEEQKPDWASWYEYDPNAKAHVSLIDMTRDQLIDAAARRHLVGIEELRRAEFMRVVASRLAPSQCVKEVWSADDLTDLCNRLDVDVFFSVAGDLAQVAEAAD